MAESGCVGMCVNLCRTPVQTFFGEELGVPLRITPNFEDFSCEFEYGREAVVKLGGGGEAVVEGGGEAVVKFGGGEEIDEVLRAPCLSECASAAASASAASSGAGGSVGRCPKLEG